MVDQNYEGEIFYLEFEDEDGNKQYFTEDVILNHEVKNTLYLFMYKMKNMRSR